MKIYDINPNTNELINELGRAAPLDKMSGGFKVTGNSTNKVPKPKKKNKINVFNFVIGEWELKPDYRGLVYYLPESQESTEISEIGVEPPLGYLTEPPPTPQSELNEALVFRIEKQRKEKEALGITLNSVRYAGNPENRQAISEAINFLTEVGLTEFPLWKDSDNQFHKNHPLLDVRQAYKDIGIRRSELIGLECEYIRQVFDDGLSDVSNLTWK